MIRFAGRRLLDDDDVAVLEEHIDVEQRALRAYRLLGELSDTDREPVQLE